MAELRSIVAVILIASLVGAAPLSGQEQPTTATHVGGLRFIDRVDVTVVTVAVHVRDSAGRPVAGLTPADFHVVQDGVEVAITNFQELTAEVIATLLAPGPSTPAPASSPTVEVAAPAPTVKPVWLVIYVDNENIHPMKRNRVLRRVREFVTESLAPPVQAMVVSYQRSLKVVQPFTADPMAVNNALRDLQETTGGAVDRQTDRTDIVREMQDQDSRDYGATKRDNSASAKHTMYQRVMNYARDEANELSFTLAALRQTVANLAGLEGRKSIIYVSSGLPMTPGLGLMHQYAATFDDTSILSRRYEVDRLTEFQSLTAAAASQEVTFYTVDVEGLEVIDGLEADSAYGVDPEAASIGRSNYQASLRYMAERTGGLAVVNTNDPSAGLKRIREDLVTYYSIGYISPVSWSDKVHEIELTLPGHASLDVRYRRRFVEKSLETRTQDRVQGALLYDVADNPMGIAVAAGKATPGTGLHWLVPVQVTLPLTAIALLPDGSDLVGRVTLFVGARDQDGKESGVQRQEHEIRVPASAAAEPTLERVTLEARLLMAEGSHRVAVGVLDTVTRSSSYSFQRITVP